VELEKTLLRKVGEAVSRFQMIRDGDRVAVALSGGKDSLTLLEALLLLQKRAPIDFTVCAFTVEQGKFLRPFGPMGEYLKSAASIGRTTLTIRRSDYLMSSPITDAICAAVFAAARCIKSCADWERM
jgi:hypothetical protein